MVSVIRTPHFDAPQDRVRKKFTSGIKCHKNEIFRLFPIFLKIGKFPETFPIFPETFRAFESLDWLLTRATVDGAEGKESHNQSCPKSRELCWQVRGGGRRVHRFSLPCLDKQPALTTMPLFVFDWSNRYLSVLLPLRWPPFHVMFCVVPIGA